MMLFLRLFIIFWLLTVVTPQSDAIIRPDPSDKITTLNATNYEKLVFNSNSSWLILYYKSWCRHCINFYQLWRKFALDIENWKGVVSVGSIDCDDPIMRDQNLVICSSNNVSWVPDIRYFPPFSWKPLNGTKIEEPNTVDNLISVLCEHLQRTRQYGLANWWPSNIVETTAKNLQELWNSTLSSSQYFVLIVENRTSYLAIQLIMDFLHSNRGPLIYFTRNSSNLATDVLTVVNRLTDNNNNIRPSLYVVYRNYTVTTLNSTDKSRKSFVDTLTYFLYGNVTTEQKNGSVSTVTLPASFLTVSPSELSSSITSSSLVTAVVDISKRVVVNNNNNNNNNKLSKKLEKLTNTVYQSDLEKALHLSLYNEIAAKPVIADRTFVILRNYLNVLRRYFPTGRTGKRFFERLLNSLVNRTAINGLEFLKILKKNDDKSLYYTNKEWISCKGSVSGYRGYPCGLWLLFHTLTVRAADEKPIHGDNTYVLKTITGYVSTFFSCRQCALHFVDMTEKSNYRNLKTAEQAILWLWKAHNEVNARLSSDTLLVDPLFPKIEFPTKSRCPNCRRLQLNVTDNDNNDGGWNERTVLSYLKKMYGRIYIAPNRPFSINNDDKNNRNNQSINYGKIKLQQN